MNYLAQLLSSLDEAELSMVGTARLTPTERALLEHFQKQPSGKEDGVIDPASALGLTQNSLYKNSSVLLRKSYEVLMPNGGLDLLFFLLKKKYLFDNGIRELERQERQDVPRMNDAERERFYFGVFHLLRSVQKYEVPMPYFVKYGKRLVQERRDPHPDDERAIKIYLQERKFTKDVKETTKLFSPAFRQRHLQKLRAHAVALADSTNAFARFNLHCAFYSYYYRTHTELDQLDHHLESLLEWLPRELEEIFPWSRIARSMDRGTIYVLRGEYETAYSFYQAHFDPDSAEYYSMRVPMDYFVASIYAKHYEQAETVIRRIHAKDLATPLENSVTSVAAAMWLALTYLDWGRYVEAGTYLANAARWNQKDSYSPYNEAIIRTLDTCYRFLNKEWDYLDQLIVRNRQWLRRNEFAGEDSHPALTIELTKAFTDHMFAGKPVPATLLERRERLLQGELSGLVGRLLDRMRAIAEQQSIH